MAFNYFHLKRMPIDKRTKLPKEILLDFFSSAEWITRTDDYLEKESIIFEPSSGDSKEHQQIFDNYKAMTGQTLAEFRKQRGDLTDDQLAASIQEIKSEAQTNSYLRNLMQPWLMQENYEKFKEAMIQENIESQMLAIESISKKTGEHPFSREGKEDEDPALTRARIEEEVFQRALRISKEEYDELQRQLREEEDAIERALRESERLSQMFISTTEMQISVHDLREFIKQSEALEAVAEEEEDDKQKVEVETVVSKGPDLEKLLSQHKPDDFVSARHFISPEELQRRQAYLRAQKDKLHSKRESLQEEANKSGGEKETLDSASVLSRRELAKLLKTQLTPGV